MQFIGLRYIERLSLNKLKEIQADNYRYWIKTGETRDLWDYREEIDSIIRERETREQIIEFRNRQKEREERLSYLQSLLPLLTGKFKKVKDECLMLIYIELEKIGMTPEDLWEV